MSSRFSDRLTFRLERLLVRGAQYRLLVIAGGIGLISVLGGAAVLAAGTGFHRFDEAMWWAFLRLTDPGYLGDDVGTVNRTVSTVLTVLGYVVFLGALVAVMTQWLNQRMERLEAGLTPVARNGHVVILGWTNRTEAILRELLVSRERVRRFLRRVGTRDLHVVVMARTLTANLAQDLRDAIGEQWEEHQVTLRSGTPLRPEHLERVDARNASAIIIPASEQAGGADRADTHTIKALLSLARSGVGGRPYVVAEVLDNDKAMLAERIYPGDIEVIRSHSVVSRLLAQNVRQTGLSAIYNQLLTSQNGAEIFVPEAGTLAGLTMAHARQAFPRAVLMGVVRPGDVDLEPTLNPPGDLRIEAGDRLIVLAHGHAHIRPRDPGPEPAAPDAAVRRATTARAAAGAAPGDAGDDSRAGAAGHPSVEAGPEDAARRQGDEPLRVLILGWSHEMPALLEEFRSYPGERFVIHDVSMVPAEERQKRLRHVPDRDGLEVQHVQADFTQLRELEALEPASYDAVLFLGSDWLATSEESDARTVVGVLLLQQLLENAERRPAVIVELLDPDNERLLGDHAAEVIISPLIVSHMLAQVALRRELLSVFEELFTAGGAEIAFRPSQLYADDADSLGFTDIERAAAARGETALGVRTATNGGELLLVPDRNRRWTPGPDLDVVTLVRED